MYPHYEDTFLNFYKIDLAIPDPIPTPTPAAISININITTIIKKQKYERAKFFKFLFLVPPNEKTKRSIKPIIGIANNISYPKYPHIEIGLYSYGI